MNIFLKGFYEVLPAKCLSIFDVNEFGLLLAGVKKIDCKSFFFIN